METSKNKYKFKVYSPIDPTKNKVVTISGETVADAINLGKQIYQDCNIELISSCLNEMD